MSNKTEREQEFFIDNKHLLMSLLKKSWLIVICGVLLGAFAFFYNSFFVTPKYSSSVMLYVNNNGVNAGASGCGCSASMLAAHFLPRVEKGEIKKILFLSTGALMSPGSVQQKNDILGIAPAILIKGDQYGS